MASITLWDEIAKQSASGNGWICPNCKNHRGNLKCKQNVFIAFVGANMRHCIFFQEKESLSNQEQQESK